MMKTLPGRTKLGRGLDIADLEIRHLAYTASYYIQL